jgi:hypothetical protein
VEIVGLRDRTRPRRDWQRCFSDNPHVGPLLLSRPGKRLRKMPDQ